MHAVSYQLKRGHLSAVAVGRDIFRGTKEPDDPDYDGVPDMTPARFDILYLVLGKKNGRRVEPGWIPMRDLWTTLGLSRATISKAVKRLGELGLVGVERDSENLRNKIVRLTEEGAARIKRALHLVFTGRALARHYQRYVAKQWDRRKKPRDFPQVVTLGLLELSDELEMVARHLFDSSETLYEIRDYDPMAICRPAPMPERPKIIEYDPWCALPTPM